MDIDKVVEEFKLTLSKNKVVKKESNVFNNFMIAYCVLYVLASILCIILGIRLL